MPVQFSQRLTKDIFRKAGMSVADVGVGGLPDADEYAHTHIPPYTYARETQLLYHICIQDDRIDNQTR